MIFKILLVIFLFISFVACQSIHCNFVVDTLYRCDATINNPTGYDGDIEITGNHALLRNDDSVREIRIVGGTTTIIPSALCRRFRNNEIFSALLNRGIRTLTENAFRDCHQLWGVSLRFNPVNEIHPQLFVNNIRMDYVDWFDFQVTTLPENLFATLTQLDFVAIRRAFSLTDLSANFFENNRQITTFDLTWNNLTIWRPEWTRHLNNLDFLSFSDNRNIPSMPRNAINARSLTEIWINLNQLVELDFFMFNDISLVTFMALDNIALRAMDFNFIDRASSLQTVRLNFNVCIARDFDNFQANKAVFMAELEPCFHAFDMRTLNFSTTGSTPVFNSVRREQIQLQVQAFSDAFLTFSANPDGSSPNFEISLGVDGNTRSCLHENGVQLRCTSTPGYLNPDRMVSFLISWSSGQVYVEHYLPVFMEPLQTPFAVRFMGVRTSGQTASWIIQQQ